MDDSRPPHPQDEGKPPDLRLGYRALALLEAARETGDPGLIVQAEAMALAAGLALAARLRDEAEET